MQKFILFIITGFIETLTICASLNNQDVQERYVDNLGKVNILLDNFDFIQTLNTQKKLDIILIDSKLSW